MTANDNAAPLVSDLTFRARALAQAHALTPAAAAYRRWRLERDADAHPVPELSEWAATAFLTGYCLRCVEQSYATPAAASVAPDGRAPDGCASVEEPPADDLLETWEREAGLAARAVASQRGATLLDPALMASALDEIIGREVEKRNEHVRETLSDEDWNDFERFIAWWVLHGYAIRTVEQVRKSVSA